MTKNLLVGTLTLVCATLLAGCGGAGGGGLVASAVGGGGSGSGGGIGGTGLTSSGTITGFGSVFVNGVEFETDGAEILVDGKSVGEEALGLGMLVLVTGSINEDGTAGSATRIVFDDDVQGPVAAVVRAADGDSMLVTVLDHQVIVERTATVFKGVSFSNLAVGDVVEVSGFADNQGRLRATRVEKKDEFLPGVSEIGLKGVVRDLVGSEFLLRGYTVSFSGADLSEVPGGVLAEGMQVEVEGTLEPETRRITASRVELENVVDSAFANEDDVDVQGLITNFVSAAELRVNGVAVDASNASLSPPDLVLEDGTIVEAEGRWENGILRARRIEGRRGQVKVEAAVATLDNVARTVTLQLVGGTVIVRVDSRTMLDDDTDRTDRLTLADVRPGDFLDIEALRQGDELVATRIDREAPHDDVLQANLDAYITGDSITLLGITYSTAGAEFKALDQRSLSEAEFYAALAPGALVKVRDRAPADGVADRVEFEYVGVLDGERDFDDEDVDKVDAVDGVDKVDEADEVDEVDEVDAVDEIDGMDEVDKVDAQDKLDEVDEPQVEGP